MSRGTRWFALSTVALSSATQACTLEEVTVVDVEDVVVAEILVQVNRAPATQNRLSAFLHRTVGGVGPACGPGARRRG